MNAVPVVPVPVPVEDGAALLDDVLVAVTDYVVLPSAQAADAVTLWIAATHCLSAFDHATRLVVESPEKRCGKSRLLEVLADTCRRVLVTVNITEAALFRSIGDDPPTLLLDEADAMFGTKIKAEQNEGLRGLLNAGYRRGLTTTRTVGPLHTPTEFPTFAMAALAGIGSLPGTIEDRAVTVTMRRRAPGETVRPYRFRRDRPRLMDLHDRLAVWADHVRDGLADAEPELPVEDRAADTWEPLVAVADAAGGDWPGRARAAAVTMVNASAEEDTQTSVNTKLLADVRHAFASSKTEFIASRELVELLRLAEESPWSDFNLNTNGLARRLSGYGVKPRPDSTGKVRGYHLSAFVDAFARYLPVKVSGPSEDVNVQQTRGFPSDGRSSSDTLTRQTLTEPSDEYHRKPSPLTVSDASDTSPAADTAPCGHPVSAVNTANGRCALCILDEIAAKPDLHRCPQCGVPTSPQRRGTVLHPSLCPACSLAELGNPAPPAARGAGGPAWPRDAVKAAGFVPTGAAHPSPASTPPCGG